MGVDVKLTGVPQFDQLEIVKTGTITLPALNISNPGAGNYSSQTAIATLTHGLGYAPAIMGFLAYASPAYKVMLPYVDYFGAGTVCYWQRVDLRADSTTLYARLDVTVTNTLWASTATDYPIIYYLLRERAG